MLKIRTLCEGRFEVIQYRHIAVVVLNFSNTGHDEAWALLEHFDHWVRGQADRSVRILLDLDGCWYDPAFVTQWRLNVERQEHHIQQIAVLNALPFSALLFRLTWEFAERGGEPVAKKRGQIFSSIKSALGLLTEADERPCPK
jgi:hypothetical protein